MEESESDDDTENICPLCEKKFETLAGIRQHWTKSHTQSEIQAAINNRTQMQPSSSIVGSQPAFTSAQQTQQQIAGSHIQSSSDTIRNRVTCSICGFLAKNDRGLRVHSRTHETQRNSSMPTSDSTNHFDISTLDEATMIRKFGELLYKCKFSIPLVRIIQ